jgi:hypothetical protein
MMSGDLFSRFYRNYQFIVTNPILDEGNIKFEGRGVDSPMSKESVNTTHRKVTSKYAYSTTILVYYVTISVTVKSMRKEQVKVNLLGLRLQVLCLLILCLIVFANVSHSVSTDQYCISSVSISNRAIS